MMKAVISSLFSSILTCQYPLVRSNEVNHPALLKLTNISSYRGMRYLFHLVLALSFLKLRHIRQSPVFFTTITIDEAQELADFLIIPLFSRLSSSFLSQILSRWSIRRHLYAISALSNSSIVCLMILVWLRSLISEYTISEYSWTIL